MPPLPTPPRTTPLGQVFRLTVKCGSCGAKPGRPCFPSCTKRMEPKACKRCRAPVVGRYKAALYCLACNATACRTCYRQDGTHSEKCYSHGRPARPPLPDQGIVTATDILALFVEHWPMAVRLARRIVGRTHAEDVVAQ